jgi:AbrB family looped-hinge helix DNA binding protein
MTSTLTSKGQINVPKRIRDRRGLSPDSTVAFSLGPHGEVVVQAGEASPRHHKVRRRKLHGTLATGRSNDELTSLLRGYDVDHSDPGLK